MAKQPPSQALNPPQDRPTPEFAKELAKYLEELGWPQSKLAQKTKISDAQLSRWLKSRDRALGRNHVCRLVAGLASGFLETPDCEWHAGFLDKVLNDLLLAAGYASIYGRIQDRVWAELTAPGGGPLKVGWIEYPPFTESPGVSGSASAEPVGLAAEITIRLVELTGLQASFVPCHWESIIDDLRTERIHLISPFLIKLPTRAVAFSSTIPRLYLGLNGVYNANVEQPAREALKASDQTRSKSLIAHAITGEVGESLRSMIVRGAARGDPFKSLEEAAVTLISDPLAGS